MSNNEENVLMEYVKQISLLAALALIVIWVLVILVSFFASFGAHHEVDPDAVNNRLKAIEVVAVVGGDASAAAETSSEAAKETVTADTGPIDGEAIVTATCFACHGTGILESPKIGDKKTWDKRLEANVDLDGLVQSAIKGKGAMPPSGGNAGLSDAQLKAAIEFMMK